MTPEGHPAPVEPLSLTDAVNQALEEARMVLPGIQALFGFQLIAVFNQRFDDALEPAQQLLHLVALLLVVVSTALVMTPAAYHRQVGQQQVSEALLRVCSVFIGAAMVPLMLGLCLDIYIVAELTTGRRAPAILTALGVLAVFATLWFVLPRRARRRTQGIGPAG